MIPYRLDNNRFMYTSLVTIDTCMYTSLFFSVIDTHFLLVYIPYCLCLNSLLRSHCLATGHLTISIPLSCETIKVHCKLFTSNTLILLSESKNMARGIGKRTLATLVIRVSSSRGSFPPPECSASPPKERDGGRERGIY